MKILFSVPRIHTNYSGMIKGLLEGGHHVSVISMSNANNSLPYDLDIDVYYFNPIKGKKILKNRNKQLYIPSVKSLKKILDYESPDLVIARDLMMMNVIISILLKIKKTKILYYDQTPENIVNLKHYIWINISRILISKYRITTVKRKNLNQKKFKNTYFVPFPVPISKTNSNSINSLNKINGVLKIISIGKLDQKRKNLCYLITELSSLLRSGKVELSIYGALRDKHSKVYKKLLKLIEDEKVKKKCKNL